MSRFAVLYEPDAYSTDGKVMGRQSAGAALMQAIANDAPEKVWCYARTREIAKDCANRLAAFGASKTGISWIPMDQPERLSEAGILYRPDPGINLHAWHRLSKGNSKAYSLCGITHTISSHGPMSAFADYLTAPVEPWDALICTSKTARDSVQYIMERASEYLSARMSTRNFTFPQLPIIPLGVHTEQFHFDHGTKRSARLSLGIQDDEVVFLFAGRLIVHGKAHPLPMYLALEEAAKGRKVTLIQAGIAPTEQIKSIFVNEPNIHCPSVKNIIVDGRDVDKYRAAWAASDVFTSLSDNIQETFGLTPIEAMAAGLPVVVSDWDGYKDTVRDGIEGFRIPTLMPSKGEGSSLAAQHDLGILNFDRYSGYTSQLVATDIVRASHAYRQLIDDVELRRRMGEAGRRRAASEFDWRVVFNQYKDLWAGLEERRKSGTDGKFGCLHFERPDRPDPFSMFSSYPTHQINDKINFRIARNANPAESKQKRRLSSTEFALSVTPDDELIDMIFDCFDQDTLSYGEICTRLTDIGKTDLQRALGWLSKVGSLEFSAN